MGDKGGRYHKIKERDVTKRGARKERKKKNKLTCSKFGLNSLCQGTVLELPSEPADCTEGSMNKSGFILIQPTGDKCECVVQI